MLNRKRETPTYFTFTACAALVLLASTANLATTFLWQHPLVHTEKPLSKAGELLPPESDSSPVTPPTPTPPPVIPNITYPVFLASLYKSGTTTVHSFFQCGGKKSAHYQVGRRRTGPCIRRNIANNRPPFQGCNNGREVDVWTDNADLFPPRYCFHPSIEGLEAIAQFYPNATIMLSTRPSEDWHSSVLRYNFRRWSLSEELGKCPEPHMNQTLPEFYEYHNQYVRDFARDHPSLTFLEVSLVSNETGSILEEATGIPASCWGHKNKNTRQTSL